MSQKIDFFFDVSSPWTYLAFKNIQGVIAKFNAENNNTTAEIIWRPFLVGGVHNAVNGNFVEDRNNNLASPKWQQLGQSLMDWAEFSGVTMNFPSKHHPLKSVNVMRVCCLLEHDQAALFNFMNAAFDAYFTQQLNVDDPAVLCSLAEKLQLNSEELVGLSQQQSCKDHLRANTEEAISRGAFGSPSIFVPFAQGEKLYFGNDQLPLVEWALHKNS